MIAASYSTVRQNFKEYCEKAVKDFETVIVTRKNDENVVLLSEAEYNNLMENLFIRSDPERYNELLRSIEEMKTGKCQNRELIDV